MKKSLAFILCFFAAALWPLGEAMEKGAAVVKELSDQDRPRIALTFDDGPHRIYTERLLDGLKERETPATFFLIGQNIQGNEDLVRRMEEEGHLIGNHTFHHVELEKLDSHEAKEEVLSACDAIYQVTGTYPSFVRPPFGRWKENLDLQITMIPVSWNVDSRDWTTENIEKIVKRVVKDTGEGDIILMHDIYQSSVEAALRIVDILRERGFEFVTVDELLLE